MKLFLTPLYFFLFNYLANAGEIHKATEKGDTKKVSAFLEAGVDPDLINENGATPLLLAIHRGNLKIAKLLIKHEANVNNSETVHPLFAAIGSGQLESVSFLLKHGANVNVKAKNGDTPLHDISLLDSHIIKMRKYSELKTTTVKYKEITSLLIQYGAKVNAKNNKGQTPLHFAKSAERAEILIKHGAKVNIKNNKGDTPLSIVKKRSYKYSKWDSFEKPEQFKRNKEQLLKLLSNRLSANKK